MPQNCLYKLMISSWKQLSEYWLGPMVIIEENKLKKFMMIFPIQSIFFLILYVLLKTKIINFIKKKRAQLFLKHAGTIISIQWAAINYTFPESSLIFRTESKKYYRKFSNFDTSIMKYMVQCILIIFNLKLPISLFLIVLPFTYIYICISTLIFSLNQIL